MNEESRAAWKKVCVAAILVVSASALGMGFCSAEFAQGLFPGLLLGAGWATIIAKTYAVKE